MNEPKSAFELTPSEKGNIVWLTKSGYTPEAIARETGLPLAIIKVQLCETGYQTIHISRPHANEYEYLWCPYCDEIVRFASQKWYANTWCTKCQRRFPYKHQWPLGFDIKTGELK